jgi:hypothetical protein
MRRFPHPFLCRTGRVKMHLDAQGRDTFNVSKSACNGSDAKMWNRNSK